MGFWLTGLTGGFALSKLNVPGAVSCRSLPHPWPAQCQPQARDEAPEALTCELMEANLNFKARVTVLFVHLQVFLANEGNLLVWRLGTQNIAERYIFEAFRLSDIVVVGAAACQ